MGPSPAEDDRQLIKRVRHDLNNALTALIGQAQLLLREKLCQSARQRAETIERIAKRIASSVDELRKLRPHKSD